MSAIDAITDAEIARLRARLAAAEKRADEAEDVIKKVNREMNARSESYERARDEWKNKESRFNCVLKDAYACTTAESLRRLSDLFSLDKEKSRANRLAHQVRELKAVLAAAEAVIAALPKCEQFINGDVGYCPRVATREDSVGGSGEYFTRYWCDEHQPYGADEDTWAAAQLRTYLALVEAGK